MSADNKIKTNIQNLTLNLSFDALLKLHDLHISHTNVTNQSVAAIVRYLKNSLEVLDLQYCKNVNLDTIFEAVRNLTQLNSLYYNVHTAEERCKKSAKRPKMCGNCESLKKERPGLIIYDGYGNTIANVDNYDG